MFNLGLIMEHPADMSYYKRRIANASSGWRKYRALSAVLRTLASSQLDVRAVRTQMQAPIP